MIQGLTREDQSLYIWASEFDKGTSNIYSAEKSSHLYSFELEFA